MGTSTHNLEEARIQREVRERKAKLVLIQLPEGLKLHGPRMAQVIEKLGAVAVVSADPCYGACDLAESEAETLGADLIIHYGHSIKSKSSGFPTLYLHGKADISVKTAVEKAIPYIRTWHRIGLLTTIQHIHRLDDAKNALLEAHKEVLIGNAGRLKHAGQVIGCDYSNATAISEDVEAFLFMGGGKFHAIGVALSSGKPTIVADPYERRAFTIQKDVAAILKIRWASIQETQHASKMGILIGLKAGQERFDQALKIKRRIESVGKKATLLALREITPDALMQFPSIEAFINTACPRLSLDDSRVFQRPLLTPREMKVALGELQWEELCQRNWFES